MSWLVRHLGILGVVVFIACINSFSGVSYAYTAYWAAPAGSNTIACTSIDSTSNTSDPGTYATIGRAANCATAPGDHVVLKGTLGNYTSSNHRIKVGPTGNVTGFVSGSSDTNRTTIETAPNEPRAVIIASWGGVVLFFDPPHHRDWILINRLDIDNLGIAGNEPIIMLSGHDLRVANSRLVNASGSAIQERSVAGTPEADPNYNHEILHNYICNTGVSDGNGYAVYASAQHTVIDGNELCQNRGRAVQFTTAHHVVHNPVFTNNYVHDGILSNQPGTTRTCSGVSFNGINAIAVGNIIDLSTCPSGTFPTDGLTFFGAAQNSLAYKNTLVVNGTSIEVGNSGTITFRIHNNICGGTGSCTRILSGSTGPNSHNACRAADATCGTNKVTITDAFTCLTPSPAFELNVGSPCIDAGLAVFPYTFHGPAPDTGADESPSGDTTPPVVPSNVRISMTGDF